MTQQTDSFHELSRQKRSSLPREFFEFLKHNKKWWLAPILIVMALLGGLMLFASSAAAPFIYTLF